MKHVSQGRLRKCEVQMINSIIKGMSAEARRGPDSTPSGAPIARLCALALGVITSRSGVRLTRN